MIYQSTIKTVAGTSQSNPMRTKLRMTNGLLYKIEIFFPPGSSGLLGCQIIDHATLIYPSSPGEWFTGDNIQIEFDDTYIVSLPDFSFDILTYNDDTIFDHTCVVRIGLLSDDDLIIRYLPQSLSESLDQYTKKTTTEDNAKKQADLDWLKGIVGGQ